MLKTLTPGEKQTEPVAHALKSRNALVQCNYGRFFKLYQQAPGKGRSLIDVFIDKIRTQCLQKLVVGFIATNLDLEYLKMLLAFDSLQELTKFLLERSKYSNSTIVFLCYSRSDFNVNDFSFILDCMIIDEANGSKKLNCKESR